MVLFRVGLFTLIYIFLLEISDKLIVTKKAQQWQQYQNQQQQNKGACESIKNICGKYEVNTYFNGNRTMNNILVSPRDKDPIQQK